MDKCIYMQDPMTSKRWDISHFNGTDVYITSHIHLLELIEVGVGFTHNGWHFFPIELMSIIGGKSSQVNLFYQLSLDYESTENIVPSSI